MPDLVEAQKNEGGESCEQPPTDEQMDEENNVTETDKYIIYQYNCINYFNK